MPGDIIVGRDGELGVIQAFLEGTAGRPTALVLAGEAGIGKSTLWLEGVESARERGFPVLVSRPAEPERGLAYAGLGDLFEGVLDEVLPALPAPRRTALESLAADVSVLVAVDDVQWLDPSSASALAFALRRLGEQSILLLLARRLGEGAQTPDLERAIDADRVARLDVGPLSLGATQQLLHARLGVTLPRPTLLR